MSSEATTTQLNNDQEEDQTSASSKAGSVKAEEEEHQSSASPTDIEVEEENESIESAKSVDNGKSSGKDKSDLVYLTLILVDSGKSHEFKISPKLSVTEITRHVWKNWPDSWAEERVERPDILRLIFQGRFLHDDMTLDRVRLPGKKFAMHLLPRERLPDHESHSRRQREKSGARRRGCCTVQ